MAGLSGDEGQATEGERGAGERDGVVTRTGGGQAHRSPGEGTGGGRFRFRWSQRALEHAGSLLR